MKPGCYGQRPNVITLNCVTIQIQINYSDSWLHVYEGAFNYFDTAPDIRVNILQNVYEMLVNLERRMT
jgi:hypothetical protein